MGVAVDLSAILDQQHDLLKATVATCMRNQQAALKSGTGIGAATDELRKAQKALAAYEADQARDSGGRFATVIEASRWVMAQGYLVKERSACDHIKAGVAREKDGTYRQDKVEDYARRTWENPAQAVVESAAADDYKGRLLKANAELMELKVKQQHGRLLDAAEEEARDAAVLLAIRRHLELGVVERVKGMIGDLSDILSEEQQAAAMVRLPEWIELEQERIAAAFDRLAVQGGV